MKFLGLRDFCEPDSETLTSNTQLARGIQSKNIRGLEAESPVGGVSCKAPHKLGGIGGGDPLKQFVLTIFFLQNLYSSIFFSTNFLKKIVR